MLKFKEQTTAEIKSLANNKWEINGIFFSDYDLDLFLGGMGFHVEYPPNCTRFTKLKLTMDSLAQIETDEFSFMLEYFERTTPDDRKDMEALVARNRKRYEYLQARQN